MEQFPRYQNLSYSVLALGDSHYEHFCKFGSDLDKKLASLGAVRMCDRVDCDVDLDEPFARWKHGLYARLESIVAVRPSRSAPSSSVPAHRGSHPRAAAPPGNGGASYTRDHPFLAPMVDKRPLTHEISSKQTMHLAFSIADSGLKYEAGDACGVIPQNNELVSEIDRRAETSASRTGAGWQIRNGNSSSRPSLDHLQITRLTRKMIEAYATIGQAASNCFDLLDPEHQGHLDKYTWDRGLIDLIHEYPGVLHNPADLVAMLPKLSPRLYSISSSPFAHAGEIHTTVAVVRYRSHNRERGGVCSTLLADRTNQANAACLFTFSPTSKFRLPQSRNARS